MELNYTQSILIGDQVVQGERQEVIIDSFWNRIKNVSVWIAAIAILIFTSYAGCSYGKANPDCNSNCGPATATAASATTPANTGTVVTVPGIDRLASAIEKVADVKPATATASATSAAESTARTTATPVAVTVKLAGIDHLASAVEKLAETNATPAPQAPAQTADPMAGMTPKEQCDYEIIKLRRSRCSQ